MKDLFGTLPIQATEIAEKHDWLYLFLFVVSLFFFVLVIGGMILFAIQYRKRPGNKSKYIAHNTPIEIVWTVIPTILVLIMFVWGWIVYVDMVDAPSDAYEVKVIGKQWSWQFIYDDGRVLTNEAFVPVNKPVQFVMTSEDVLHDLFVPNFRVKQDVVPGMYTKIWFEATKTGIHQIYCAEYCGTSHSVMLADLYVLSDEDWKKWQRGKEIDLANYEVVNRSALARNTKKKKRTSIEIAQSAPQRSLTDQGHQVWKDKGCVSCHSVDGSKNIGPTVKGLFGSQRALTDGSMAIADENYIRESIEKPNAKIVQGFRKVMPTFEGLMQEAELNALIAYIKTLK